MLVHKIMQLFQLGCVCHSSTRPMGKSPGKHVSFSFGTLKLKQHVTTKPKIKVTVPVTIKVFAQVLMQGLNYDDVVTKFPDLAV